MHGLHVLHVYQCICLVYRFDYLNDRKRYTTHAWSFTWHACMLQLNAGYAADGFARKQGVGCCVVTFGVGGEMPGWLQ